MNPEFFWKINAGDHVCSSKNPIARRSREASLCIGEFFSGIIGRAHEIFFFFFLKCAAAAIGEFTGGNFYPRRWWKRDSGAQREFAKLDFLGVDLRNANYGFSVFCKQTWTNSPYGLSNSDVPFHFWSDRTLTIATGQDQKPDFWKSSGGLLSNAPAAAAAAAALAPGAKVESIFRA